MPELAKLCTTCSVLRLNDEELLAAHVKENADGSTYLYLPLFSSSNVFVDDVYESLPLQWHVTDNLPGLRRLQENAELGCDFCRTLRRMIVQAQFEFVGCINITLVYTKGLTALIASLEPQAGSFNSRDIHMSGIVFTLETDCETVGSWLRIPRPRTQQTLCDSNIHFMKESIRLCEEVCCHPTFADHTPTRLIDVEPGLASGAIRLVDTSELTRSGCEAAPRYAALSYCWGTPEDAKTQLRTTAATLAAHKSAITEELMTQVLLEAVRVCRSVCVRYLWVDALCIIQDDENDWQLESSRMGLTYNNAVVTLVAGSSSSCHQSFLDRRIDCLFIPFTSQIKPMIVGHYGLYASGYTIGHDDGMLFVECCNELACPWAFRGWTLQETMMSKTQLLFGKSFIHFMCLARYGRENCGYTDCDLVSFNPISQLARHETSRPDRFQIYDAWDTVLRDFLPRRLTYIQDKLPAISGPARCVAEVVHDAYLAGLWRRDLPFGLLWFSLCTIAPRYYASLRDSADQIRQSAAYVVPSWSPVRLATTCFERGILGDRLLRQDFSARCSVTDARTTVEGRNPFGRVSGGSIRICGRFGKVPSDLLHLYCARGTYETRYLVDEGRLIAYCNVDCWNEEEIWPSYGMALLLLGTSQASASYLAKSHLPAGEEEVWHCYGDGAKLSLQHFVERTRESLHLITKQQPPCRERDSEETSDEEEGVLEDEEDRVDPGRGSRNGGLGATPSSESNSCVVGSPAASVREAPSDHGESERSSSGQRDSGDASSADDGSEASYRSRISCPIDEAFEDVDADWFEDNEDAWGLLLAPAAEEGKYIRVGAWRSIVGDGGGSRYFDKYETHEVEIV